MNNRISVIVPTFRPKDYLWECLDSLVAQTLPKDHFEVILVLNGCCEPWKSQIDDYLAKHEGKIHFQFIQTETPGVSNARNIALDNAHGDYVTFIDDDDYVSSTYLEALLEIVSNDTISLAYPYAFFDGDTKQISYRITETYDRLSRNGRQHYHRVRKYFSGPCMKLIPMNIIQDRRFDVKFANGEDSLFMFLISDKMKWCNFTSPKAIYYRRIREGSALTSHKTISYKARNTIRLFFAYSAIYFKGFPHYNFGFYLTRVLGLMKSII